MAVQQRVTSRVWETDETLKPVAEFADFCNAVAACIDLATDPSDPTILEIDHECQDDVRAAVFVSARPVPRALISAVRVTMTAGLLRRRAHVGVAVGHDGDQGRHEQLVTSYWRDRHR